MRSQAVALPTTSPLDAANTLAERITSGTLTLDELADIADGSLDVQNTFMRVRLIADRQIAQQYLFNDTDYQANTETLRRRGWTPHRISMAKSAVQLSIPQIVEFADSHTAAQKEATAAATRSLHPVSEKPERKGIAHTYTTPPIDVQLAREFGMDTSDHRTELLIDSIQRALTSMQNPKHAYVWAKYHGINDDGTIGERWTFEGIAKSMPTPVTREYVESLYYRASTHIFQTLAADVLNAWQRAMLAA